MEPKKEVKSYKFLDLLVKEVPYEYKLKKYRLYKKATEQLLYEVDDSHRFRNSVYVYEAPGTKMKDHKKTFSKTIEIEKKREPLEIYPVDVIDWEKQIFDVSDEQERPLADIETVEYINKLLETNWEDEIIYDKPKPQKPLILRSDDPNLIFEIIEKKQKTKRKPQKSTNFEKPLKNKYNISNDKYYENETKTKTSLVSYGVQHSVPALKLNPQFFRINQTKEELRNFHKPLLNLEEKTYTFSKPMQITASGSIIRKHYEITCNDLSEFVIIEYSEENPFFIVNPGMVSLLNRYYRRVDANDDVVPKNCIVLEPEDEGPFMGYGEISRGDVGESLDNNLFVAPVYKHKSTDFLIIVSENKLIFRKINHLYVAGQEFPKEEVFTPHSRKLNQFCKDQLKVASFRIFSKKKELSITHLDAIFPYFSEGSKRKWLKEYTDAQKKGKDNIFVPKNTFMLTTEEELRKLVTPENICQYQSMLSGERMMEDLGFKILDEEDDETDFIPNWILSRNFVNATNGKGLLELRGPSDPTGIGEGFSFKRMKFSKVTEAENRKLLAEHQAKYKTEISNIWSKQQESLSSAAVIPAPTIQEEKVEEISQSETAVDSHSLTIKRTYLENGITVEKIQKLTDLKLIRAYLKARKKFKPDEKKTALRCSSCRQIGHMKTNKNCPNYQGPKKKPVEKKKAVVVMQDKLIKLIGQFIQIPFSSPFHRPVSTKKFPTYPTIVKTPMDFQKMKLNIRANIYTKYDYFLQDLFLILENCKKFNGASHSLTEIAEDIYERGKKYKIENYAELSEIEQRLSKENIE
ncbi:Transcription initiation factor [Nucleospora cyclopteri]